MRKRYRQRREGWRNAEQAPRAGRRGREAGDRRGSKRRPQELEVQQQHAECEQHEPRRVGRHVQVPEYGERAGSGAGERDDEARRVDGVGETADRNDEPRIRTGRRAHDGDCERHDGSERSLRQLHASRRESGETSDISARFAGFLWSCPEPAGIVTFATKSRAADDSSTHPHRLAPGQLAESACRAAADVSRPRPSRNRAGTAVAVAAARDDVGGREPEVEARGRAAWRGVPAPGRRLRRELRRDHVRQRGAEAQDPAADVARDAGGPEEADHPRRPHGRAVREAAQRRLRDEGRRVAAELSRRHHQPARVHGRRSRTRSRR